MRVLTFCRLCFSAPNRALRPRALPDHFFFFDFAGTMKGNLTSLSAMVSLGPQPREVVWLNLLAKSDGELPTRFLKRRLKW